MIADKKFEKIERSAVKLSITVSGDGTRRAYNDVLGRYVREVQLPGFRKGKVPRQLLVRKFGESIQQQAAADIIDESVNKVLEDVEDAPISRPLIADIPALKPEEDFQFTVVYDIFPEITLESYTGIKIDEPRVKITKKDEEAELQAIRERNGVVVDKPDGIISSGSVVTMDCVELGDDDAPMENTRRKGYVFTLGRDEHPYGIEDEIEGMKAGDEKIIEKSVEAAPEPQQAAAEKEAAGSADENTADEEKADKPEAAGDSTAEEKADEEKAPSVQRKLKLQVNITAVKEWDLPDLDDELAQDVSDDLETLEDLRGKIRKDLQEYADKRIREMKINAVTEQLLLDAVIDVPESMIRLEMDKHWRSMISRSNLPEEDFFKHLQGTGHNKEAVEEGWRTALTKKVKAELIYNHITAAEEISVDDDAVSAELAQRAENYGTSPEELEESLGGGHFRDYLKDELKRNKLFDFLIDSASVRKGKKIEFESLKASEGNDSGE